MALRAAGRGRPVLRRPDARRDRRARRPLARAAAGGRDARDAAAGGAARDADAGAADRSAAPAAAGTAAAARHLPLDLGRARGRDLPRAAVRDRRAAARALARGRRRLGIEQRRRRRGRRRTARRLQRDARRPLPAVPAGTAFLADGIAQRLGQRPDRAAVGRSRRRREHLLADVFYFEPWWIQIVKALVIFGVIFARPADADHLRAQAARPLPGPLRPQPRRPVRAAAADGRDRQVRRQGAVPADARRSASCSGSRR